VLFLRQSGQPVPDLTIGSTASRPRHRRGRCHSAARRVRLAFVAQYCPRCGQNPAAASRQGETGGRRLRRRLARLDRIIPASATSTVSHQGTTAQVYSCAPAKGSSGAGPVFGHLPPTKNPVPRRTGSHQPAPHWHGGIRKVATSFGSGAAALATCGFFPHRKPRVLPDTEVRPRGTRRATESARKRGLECGISGVQCHAY